MKKINKNDLIVNAIDVSGLTNNSINENAETKGCDTDNKTDCKTIAIYGTCYESKEINNNCDVSKIATACTCATAVNCLTENKVCATKSMANLVCCAVSEDDCITFTKKDCAPTALCQETDPPCMMTTKDESCPCMTI